MRHPILVFLIVIHCVAASAAEVDVKGPRTILLRTMEQLRDRCVAEGKYDACTRFVAYRLKATCAPVDEDQWSIRGVATYTPWIMLYEIHSLSHELEHIGDIKEFVLEHLTALEALRFGSQGDCAARGALEEKLFPETLRAAAVKSNALRR